MNEIDWSQLLIKQNVVSGRLEVFHTFLQNVMYTSCATIDQKVEIQNWDTMYLEMALCQSDRASARTSVLSKSMLNSYMETCRLCGHTFTLIRVSNLNRFFWPPWVCSSCLVLHRGHAESVIHVGRRIIHCVTRLDPLVQRLCVMCLNDHASNIITSVRCRVLCCIQAC